MTLYLLAHTLCGGLAYGIMFADLCAEYPEANHRESAGFAMLCALLGPLGLLVVFLETGFARHGLRYAPPKRT